MTGHMKNVKRVGNENTLGRNSMKEQKKMIGVIAP
jgi:hypothetical protein